MIVLLNSSLSGPKSTQQSVLQCVLQCALQCVCSVCCSVRCSVTPKSFHRLLESSYFLKMWLYKLIVCFISLYRVFNRLNIHSSGAKSTNSTQILKSQGAESCRHKFSKVLWLYTWLWLLWLYTWLLRICVEMECRELSAQILKSQLYLHFCSGILISIFRCIVIVDHSRSYGVATISRLLKMIGLFCRISSLL